MTVAVQQPATVTEQPKTGDFKQDLYNALCKAGLNYTADALQSSEVRVEGNEVVVRAPKMMMLALKDPGLSRIAAEVAGKPVKVRTEVGEGTLAAPPSSNVKSDGEDNQVRQRALSHPGVKRFQELFPEAQVRAVRNLNE
ncbi:MAG: hypothetical protein JO150_18395 [Acidobacteriaceae bacterium]|nr:hypothetical protein [Acidobacteriaceae bacterium]